MNRFCASDASIEIMRELERNGHEAVFVGGAVRDYLLGKDAEDIDIATSASPYEVRDIFNQTIDIGIEHGTILVLVNHEPIEVTTYRSGNTDAEKSLHEDLLHRDFTINALALTRNEKIIDLFDGQKDLKSKVIRAVGLPEGRFREDPLRMIRAVRFASVLDFDIDRSTFEAIQKYAHLLESVSVERIKVEFDKLLMGKNPLKGLQLIKKSDLDKVLPAFPSKFSKVRKLIPFQSAKEGWASLMILGDMPASKMSASYKLSNDEKRFLTLIQKAYTIRSRRKFEKAEIYFFELEILNLTEKIYCAIVEIDFSDCDFAEMKANYPIQSKADLRVDGKDLMCWANARGGRWVGEWIEKIEYAVLYGHCENHPDTIKEWFINDYNSER